MKLNRIIVALAVLVIIFGGIFISQKLGWWKTKNSGAGSGKAVIGRYLDTHEEDESHDEETELREKDEDHEEISYAFEVSGSTTIADVIEMGLTEDEIVSVIGKYENESQTVKDAATANGISFGKAKTALNEMINN